MYHIRIESSEVGVIFEAETPSFHLVLDKSLEKGERDLQTVGRGFNDYEFQGIFQWIAYHQMQELSDCTIETEPLVDEDTNEGDS